MIEHAQANVLVPSSCANISNSGCGVTVSRTFQVALGDSRRMSVMAAAAASGHVQIMRYLSYTQVRVDPLDEECWG